MRYLSVCSGIEAATVAWAPLGWRALAFSEIEPFCCAVLRHHYPEVPNWGDLTRFEEWPDAAVDVLCGGTPCQSFSVAGDRAGLDDPRGALLLAFVGLAARARPRWVVWENVPGVLSADRGRAFATLIGLLAQLGYGFAWRVLDAQYFGLAQRRARVFLVGYLGDWHPAAAVLFERASLSGHPAPGRAAGKDIAASLAPSLTASGRGVERCGESRGQDPVVVGPLTAATGPRGHGGSGLATDKGAEAGHILAFGGNNTSGPIDVAPALLAQPGSGYKGDFDSETFLAQVFKPSAYTRGKDGALGAVVPPLSADADKGDQDPLVLVPAIAFHGSQDPDVSGDVTHPLGRNYGQETCIAFQERGRTGGANLELGGDLAFALTAPAGGGRAQERNVATGMRVRRLTPRECERLQGFPDDYTLVPYRRKPATDGPRYRALGNSWAVPVVRWIGQRLAAVDQLLTIDSKEAA